MDNQDIWKTRRQKLISTLKNVNSSIDLRSLMKEFEYPNKKSLIRDIMSIIKTLKNEQLQVMISAPYCNACGYTFRIKKELLKIPSKCPKCKEQRIEWPTIKLT